MVCLLSAVLVCISQKTLGLLRDLYKRCVLVKCFAVYATLHTNSHCNAYTGGISRINNITLKFT